LVAFNPSALYPAAEPRLTPLSAAWLTWLAPLPKALRTLGHACIALPRHKSIDGSRFKSPP
jgi:hypothetical protein